jgi:phosphoserine phosphatase
MAAGRSVSASDSVVSSPYRSEKSPLVGVPQHYIAVFHLHHAHSDGAKKYPGQMPRRDTSCNLPLFIVYNPSQTGCSSPPKAFNPETFRNPQHMKSTGKTTQQQTTSSLNAEGNWFPNNLALINSRIKEISPATTRPQPVAIFDFDNTCIFRDVGQAVFRYQLLHLRYHISPDQLEAILPATPATLAGRPLTTVIASLLAAYRQLWPLIVRNEGEKARQLPEYRLFTALLLWFTDMARKDAQLGPRYVLPFMGKLLAGQSLPELQQLAADVLDSVMAEPLTEETITFEAPEPLGRIETSYPLGLHAQQEMKGLMQKLQDRGIACYVVSASTEWLVEEAVRLLKFPVNKERIFGIRVSMDAGGLLTTQDPESYPITFREGKTEIIRQFIKGTPILVAGDADTDFEMLTLPEVAIRLLINRNQTGLISTLYDEPDILLQGLDLQTGLFRPFRESI